MRVVHVDNANQLGPPERLVRTALQSMRTRRVRRPAEVVKGTPEQERPSGEPATREPHRFFG
jgi:hypothetical protein